MAWPFLRSVRIKRMCTFFTFIVLLLALAISATNWWVCRSARGLVSDLAHLPANDVALVLGTSPIIGRWSNPFFVGRMNAAAQLFQSGKARHLLVSGDNRRHAYDEPTAMRDALLARGVPENAITLDYAGFRTLDSIARAKAVFGVTRVTIVTDHFHLPRALFLAQTHGLDAIGFASERVPFRWAKKTLLREVASRMKAWLDVYVLHTQPHFYGPPVELQIARGDSERLPTR